jgi:hypothetical protein
LFAQDSEKAPPPAAPPPAPAAPSAAEKPQKPELPVNEETLAGTYLQSSTGGIVRFEKGGKISGWPMNGTYKMVGPGRMEILSGPRDKPERLHVEVQRRDGGLLLTRNVEGKAETTPLIKLEQVALDVEHWQGAAVIHVLLATDKTATTRAVTLDKDGYFRTKEGGFYIRILTRNGKPHAFIPDPKEPVREVSVWKNGPLLAIFDNLAKPSLLAIIELKDRR